MLSAPFSHKKGGLVLMQTWRKMLQVPIVLQTQVDSILFQV